MFGWKNTVEDLNPGCELQTRAFKTSNKNFNLIINDIKLLDWRRLTSKIYWGHCRRYFKIKYWTMESLGIRVNYYDIRYYGSKEKI